MNPSAYRLRPVVDSIIASELAAFRGPSYERSRRAQWGVDASVNDSQVDADSADLIGVQTSVSDFFGLYDIGEEDALRAETALTEWAGRAERSFTQGNPPIAFRTSGSTGEPKRIERDRAELIAEAAWFAERWQNTQRVVSLVPPHHIYGFTHSVLLPCALDIPTVDAEFQTRIAVVRSLHQDDLIVATPAIWRDIARLAMPFTRGVRGVTAGGKMDTQTWDRLRSIGLEQLTDVYGSTETGAIGVRTQPDAPFEAINPDTARAAALDALEWVSDSAFFVGERSDGMLVVAGVNVSPAAIEQFLCAQPEVSDAAVRVQNDRLIAFLVPSSTSADTQQIEAAVRSATRAELPAPQRPASFTFGPAIPTNSMGKRCAWTAAA